MTNITLIAQTVNTVIDKSEFSVHCKIKCDRQEGT